MEIFEQIIIGTFYTAFMAATVIDIFDTLRGSYDTGTENIEAFRARQNIESTKFLERTRNLRSSSKNKRVKAAGA
ncbi:hypothetical protein [uncultured Mediterranean phage uvMED]|nr:hypothetical protein [uncultured Mediterranean phage uvMED]